MSNAGISRAPTKAEDVAHHYPKGMHFVEELLRENERLRYKLIHLNQEMANLSDGDVSEVLDEENILLTMQEILLHLVGAEVFSIWMVDQAGGSFDITASTDESDLFNGDMPGLEDSMLRRLQLKWHDLAFWKGTGG